MYKFGIVGCGRFIADMHIKGAMLDHRAQLVCGCFSRDAEVAAKKAEKYQVQRVYSDYKEMCRKEAEIGELDFIVIATPNTSHYEICKTFLEAGFHVMCDKPLTTEGYQAEELAAIAREKGRLLGVSYTYYGYPMLAEARHLIQQGVLGELMSVNAWMQQDGRLQELLDGTIYANNWKQTPQIVGKASTLFDIGVHLDYTIRRLTGLKNEKILAVLYNRPNNPPLDTASSILVEYSNGVSGNYVLSQTAAGASNDMRIEIYGTKGSILWDAREINILRVRLCGQPEQTYIANRPYNSAESRAMCRLPIGMYEGAYEAFANIYDRFLNALDGSDGYFPNMDDGILGVRFVEACLRSHEQHNAWVEF